MHNQSFQQEATEAPEKPDSELGLCSLRLLLFKFFFGCDRPRCDF
jgi:hypothetical protein